MIRADNPGPFTLDGTRSWIVGQEAVAVIDPGPAVASHLQSLLRELSGAGRVDILVTHSHPDHAGSAPALANALGGRGRIGGPAPGGRTLVEGEEVDTDAGPLRVLDTPGHARPHLSFLHEETGTLFCGDLLLGAGDTTWVGEYPGAVADYLSTLQRLRTMALRRILPAHGPPIEDPGEALDRFLRHREARIRQVEGLLQEIPGADPDPFVERIYGAGVEGRVRDAAVLSVRAILHHLGVGTDGAWGPEPE